MIEKQIHDRCFMYRILDTQAIHKTFKNKLPLKIQISKVKF